MMRDLFVCFSKEFKFYFQSKIVYLLLFVYTAMVSSITLYATDFYVNTSVSMYQFFKFQPGILSMIIPALTMRFWADEYKHNTLEVLLTQPISYWAVVLGKFMAAWIVVGIMLLATFGLWCVVGCFVDLDNSLVLVNYLLAFLMSGALCGVACLASVVTYNALKAFLIGLAACLVITNVSFGSFVGKVLPDNVFLENLFKYFNFTQLFDEMIKGQIGIASLLYFLMIIVFSLVMVETIVEHKKG